jgi:hypothetical protein
MLRALVLYPVLVAAGCGVADFDVDQPVPAQTIQGSGLPAPLAAIFPLPLNLDISSKIKARDTGPIDGVTLSSLTLNITSSGDGGWSFVTSIDVFVASTKSGSTLPRAKIASVASPGAVRTLSFHVEGVNLKPYIDEGSQVDSAGMGTQPTQDVMFDGKGVFTVHPL